MNKFFQSILVFLVTIVFVAFGAEIYYRYLNPQILGNTGSLSYKKWAKKNIKMNSWGFRDKERTAKKADPNTYRVVVFGPSNVFGQGVTDLNERITERLERILSESPKVNRPVEVINMGAMTLDTVGTAMQLSQTLINKGVEFDSVVLYYPWNAIKNIPEIGMKYYKLKKSHYKKPASSFEKFLGENFYAYDWLKAVNKDKSYNLEGKTYNEWHMDFYKEAKYFKMHIDALAKFDRNLKNSSKQLYLLITPVSYDQEKRDKYQNVSDNLLSGLLAKGLQIADAREIYNGIAMEDVRVSPYDGHNKPHFYEDMAKILAGKISAVDF